LPQKIYSSLIAFFVVFFVIVCGVVFAVDLIAECVVDLFFVILGPLVVCVVLIVSGPGCNQRLRRGRVRISGCNMGIGIVRGQNTIGMRRWILCARLLTDD
jgi:hypothetical protein